MQNLWQTKSHDLRNLLTLQGHADYLTDAEAVHCSEDTLILHTSDEAAALLFDRDVRQAAEACLLELVGAPISIELRYDGAIARQATLFEAANVSDADGTVGRSSSAQRARSSRRRESSGLAAAQTFHNFVSGSCNRFAHAAAMAVCDSPGELYTPLFIYGGVGLGKTHLLNAIGNELVQRDAQRRVRYLSAESFANEFHGALVARKMDEFRRRYRHEIDVLLVDDIQMIQPMEKAQEEFFHTFNAINQRGGQIVVTCDRVPEELPNLQERLRSRLGMGLSCDIRPPERETRLEILARKAESMNWDVPQDVLDLIAQSVRGNVRQLQGALHRVCSFAELQGVPLTLTMARKQLAAVTIETPARPSVDALVGLVCETFGVQLKDIRGRRRVARYSEPRKVAMYLCRQYNGASYPELGHFFDRDHTTVLSAFNAISRDLRNNTALAARVRAIEKRLQAPE